MTMHESNIEVADEEVAAFPEPKQPADFSDDGHRDALRRREAHKQQHADNRQEGNTP